MTREQVALQSPGDRDLTGFPVTSVTAQARLYRAHRRDLGPWYFGNSGGGRYDLADDRGTCYLAFDPATAIRETLGASLHQLGVVTAKFARERVLSELNLPADRQPQTFGTAADEVGITVLGAARSVTIVQPPSD
ncbi:RES family NAD+ phosphorylase [Gordonia sp. HY285]|uniref:RES family NAD+ phosphorylase n=1 Tax=Gordonia liuliyuniae TaxID=2911517 RepID=UPI001F42EB9A|nr:RES family NAD+ phosphorylase [Gordonia liuliyuniae]MCF8611697.1 RES family NAD+ phosphorylase [Gordonia liuliyuniae]